MKKHIKNITSLFIAFILLSGGNFAFALAHGDCVMVENGYISCEMECCEETPCVEDVTDGKVLIKDDSKSCCQVHIEESMEQDVTLPVVIKNPEISKIYSFDISSDIFLNESSALVPVIHKFKTTNILLITTSLRI